jgi:hypothetical protein
MRTSFYQTSTYRALDNARPGGSVNTGYNARTGEYNPAHDEQGGRFVTKEYQADGFRAFLPRGRLLDTGYNATTGEYNPYTDQTQIGTIYTEVK